MYPFIPEPLFMKILTLKPVLAHGGTVELRLEKGRVPRYRLRWRGRLIDTGRVRQWSLTLPGPEAAHAVEQLIRHWRNSREHEVEKCYALIDQVQLERQKRQDERRELLSDAPGGRRYRRRLRREFDSAMGSDDPRERLQYVTAKPWTRPAPKAGRPLGRGFSTW